MLGCEPSFENVLCLDIKYWYTFSSSSFFHLLFSLLTVLKRKIRTYFHKKRKGSECWIYLESIRKYMKVYSGGRTRCKFVPGWSVCISIRNSVSNGMLYVEDDIRIVESERSHCRRAMVWEGHVTFVKYKIMLMVNYRSVHSRLSAHAVYTPPPNRRRCPGCVRHQILGKMEMHVIGLLSTWEIPFAERSTSILACVFSAFAVRLRSWLSTFIL